MLVEQRKIFVFVCCKTASLLKACESLGLIRSICFQTLFCLHIWMGETILNDFALETAGKLDKLEYIHKIKKMA
jgi:hypothetical protein